MIANQGLDRIPASPGRDGVSSFAGAGGMTSQLARNPARHPLVHELLYRSLFREGRGFSFPCDAKGGVEMDALTETARNNYLFARAMVGRELATPEVRAVSPGFALGLQHHLTS